MQILPDEVLVERTRAGQREAFGGLVERYQDRLFRYVRHLGFGDEDAADIVQDAFVRAYRHLRRCGDPSRFGGWIFKITGNLCRTAGARARRREMLDVESVTLVDPGSGPGSELEASSDKHHIRASLDELPFEQREAVILFYMMEYSVREIAALTGASTSAVKMRLKRAREALRERLGPLIYEKVA